MKTHFIFFVLAATAAHASGNVKLFNGQERDVDPPQHFTGEVSYRDMETKKISSREQYVEGEREGPYVEYDIKSGNITDSGTYHHGKYHGVRRHYGDDGVIQHEYAYSNGELQGVQKSYRDGLVDRVYLMVPGNNLPDVDFQLNKKGQLTTLSCGKQSISKQDAEWCGMNGKQSTVSFYTDDGKVRSTEQYLWGKRHGLSQKFNVKTGAVREEEKYEHGKLQKDGEKIFDKAGDLLVKTDCDDKRESCTETEFFEGGKDIKTLTVWKKGVLDQRTSKYQNGKVRESLTTEKDHKHIVRYNDEGEKQSDGLYVASSGWSWQPYVPDGTVEHWYDGTLSMRARYKEGNREGVSEFFWVKDGKKVREESTYTKDRLVKQKLFVNDKLAGELEYLPDGSLKSRKEYDLPKGIEI